MENGEDPFADFWISNWERQCEIELENEPDLEGQVLSERDLSTQKLWHLFQNSATSVAQLFKGKPIKSTEPKSVTVAEHVVSFQIETSLRFSGYHFKQLQEPLLHCIKVSCLMLLAFPLEIVNHS